MRELCYIPILGGGFNLRPSDVREMELEEAQAWMRWRNERRAGEMKG